MFWQNNPNSSTVWKDWGFCHKVIEETDQTRIICEMTTAPVSSVYAPRAPLKQIYNLWLSVMRNGVSFSILQDIN